MKRLENDGLAGITSELWRQIGEAFDHAIGLPALERENYLKALFSQSPDIAREVSALIDAHERSATFLEEPIGPKIAEAILESRTRFDPGSQVEHFEIIEKIGGGSFGMVYRARDLSLNRVVAVKISPNVGDEARTLASLDHENIVTVFSERIREADQIRLVCMQYVAGANLDQILHALSNGAGLDGSSLLKAAGQSIGTASANGVERLDGVACVLWLGLRLAEALAHAHQRGILHLDVKPGNILIGELGRPYLADFNISIDQRREARPALVGGTMDYMAPEHALFLKSPEPSEEALDGRADVYSLGVVMKKLWALVPKDTIDPVEASRIDRIWDRATEPDRSRRFRSSRELAGALANAREQHETLLRLPRARGLVAFFCRHPIGAIFLFTLFSQLLASIVNISYNSLRIVSHLSFVQQRLFERSLFLYNPILYSLCIVALLIPLWPLYDFAKRPRSPRSSLALERLRRRALGYPLWVAGVTTVGWTVGALLFPLTLHLFAGGLSSVVFFHFGVSFVLSWLIALSYSFLFTQVIGVRALYPRLWDETTSMKALVPSELRPIERRSAWFRLGTGGIPLIAVALLVFLGPESFDPRTYAIYRWLVIALNAMGMAGYFIALKITRDLAQTVSALEGGQGSPPTK